MFSQSSATATKARPQEPTERNLVEAAQSGQRMAFGTLCERYGQQLLRAAHRITRSHEDAEDAVQDAMMRAFVHVKDFDGRSSFATWITRIAINSALMILRKKRSCAEIAMEGSTSDEQNAGPIYEIADRTPSPENHYARHEEKRLLRKAVQRLRPTLRDVVEMHQLQETSMRETAHSMGISLAAAKARLFHAKVALRRSATIKMMKRRRAVAPVRMLSAA